MCSIAGFISESPLDRHLAMRLSRALLFYGRERGDQSTGAYVNGRIAKQATRPEDFIETSAFFNLFDKDPSIALLHTRFPTSGGRGDKQAQPFRVGSTVTVHNGMLPDVYSIKAQWNIKKKSGVDSELVTSFIDSYGIKRLPELLESTWGCAALGIISQNPDTLYLLSDGNPIVWARTKLADDNTLFTFASTAHILMSALKHVFLMSDTTCYNLTPLTLFQATAKRLKVVGKVSPMKDVLWGYGIDNDVSDNGQLWAPDSKGIWNPVATRKERRIEKQLRKEKHRAALAARNAAINDSVSKNNRSKTA